MAACMIQIACDRSIAIARSTAFAAGAIFRATLAAVPMRLRFICARCITLTIDVTGTLVYRYWHTRLHLVFLY
jgi:hypothetical protein